MPYFGTRSLKNLSECSWHLQRIAQEVIKEVDFSIICGSRREAAQNEAFYKGASRVLYPGSKHNLTPSEALDFIPCPFKGWDDKKSFKKIVDVFKLKAGVLNIIINCGLDWGWDAGHIEEV